MLVALSQALAGSYKWVLPRIDTDPLLDFTYLGNINAYSSMKEPEHKICQFEHLTIISLYQGLY